MTKILAASIIALTLAVIGIQYHTIDTQQARIEALQIDAQQWQICNNRLAILWTTHDGELIWCDHK